MTSNVIQGGETSSRSTIAGRDTLLTTYDAGAAQAFFRAAGLTVVVFLSPGDGAGPQQTQTELRRLLEGLRRVHVNDDGKVTD